MDAQPALDWKTVHEQTCTIVDLHAHPSLNVSLFNRAISKRVYPSTRAFDPFSVRTNIHQLQQGSVDVLLSVIYPPERGIVEECKYIKLLKGSEPFRHRRITTLRSLFVLQASQILSCEYMVRAGQSSFTSCRVRNTGTPCCFTARNTDGDKWW